MKESKHKMKSVVACIECGYPYSNQWISVEDRLPEKAGYYLCWHIAWDGVSDAYFDGSGKFFEYEAYNLEDEVVVSHWQSLPAIPEQE